MDNSIEIIILQFDHYRIYHSDENRYILHLFYPEVPCLGMLTGGMYRIHNSWILQSSKRFTFIVSEISPSRVRFKLYLPLLRIHVPTYPSTDLFI